MQRLRGISRHGTPRHEPILPVGIASAGLTLGVVAAFVHSLLVGVERERAKGSGNRTPAGVRTCTCSSSGLGSAPTTLGQVRSILAADAKHLVIEKLVSGMRRFFNVSRGYGLSCNATPAGTGFPGEAPAHFLKAQLFGLSV